MKTIPLHPDFGVEVQDVDLRDLTGENLYPEIRKLFEEHSLLLFREQQHLTDEEHLRLGRLFGPIEDREERAEPQICPVSNAKPDGGVIDEFEEHTLHLKSNQLWHTDSTFLPTPALANILQARVVSSTGGETELVSTRAGWKRMDPALKAQIGDKVLLHRYAHSCRKIDARLAEKAMFTKWNDQAWRAIWSNPVTGEDAVYIASHAFAIEGMDETKSQKLIDQIIAAMTRPNAIYTHT